MLRSATFREALHSRRYRLFAALGLVLLVLSAVWWGQGWWAHLLQLAGAGLIVLPLPSRPSPKKRESTPELRPGGGTGTRAGTTETPT
ncbi:hypothetical protein [Intrasporangium sp. DVR]|uniref:hypothetical protein n=1 Tax=Intrasporangium sp. DVR TaxID=3127867 RepID=UPI00313A591F